MARIRSIKPDFWTDDTITECSLSARLLFIGVWNFADDAGNLDRSAKQIKARVFPVDNIDCEPLLRELITHGLLIEYSVNGQKYLHIPGFAKHQVINRPSKPSVPAYSASVRDHGTLTEPSVSTHSGGEGKGREGSVQESSADAEAPPAKKVPRAKKPALTPIASDFGLSPDLRAYVERTIPDADPDALMADFRGKAEAKAWTYANWAQAFQGYARNCAPGSGHWSAGMYPKRRPKVGSNPLNPHAHLDMR